MTARPRRLPRREHGFVLVGVIIFVLALTILALSLYGLSGFEAQFLEQNVAHDQAFYRAESGQELVKELLSQTLPDSSYYLQNAHKAIGIEGVVDATAWQMNGANPITAGLVDWSQPVYINVKAAYGGETRTVEGQFIGAPRRDPYQQLITSSNWIQYGDPQDPRPGYLNLTSRVGTVTMVGRVWQDSTAAPNTSWQSLVNWTSGPPLLRDPAPTPLATEFINQNLPGATALPGSPLSVSMSADPAQPFTCFVGPPTLSVDYGTQYGPHFSLYVGPGTQVFATVRGTCVWLFPYGVRFDAQFHVSGTGPNPVLIIVAGPNGANPNGGLPGYADRGIWFFNGLDVGNNTTVYLVTDGVTDLEGLNGLDANSNMNNLSIFTHGLFFAGPCAPPLGNKSWTMQYAPGMDALAQQLESLGALPASGGLPTSTFTLVPGSWREP